jgi:hypothetical protein
MTTKFTKEDLAAWIKDIMEFAKEDSDMTVSWFGKTIKEPFCIVAGWQKMFKEDYSDLFCASKSQPEYVMCVKIAINDKQLSPDFESLNMPMNAHFEEVDDTMVPLEWDDNPEVAAEFFMHEWERITKAHGKEI